MTPHELLSAFETLADAPDGVKRLRELVLDLAVKGRLVPQDSTNERLGEQGEGVPEGWTSGTVADWFDVRGGIQKSGIRTPKDNAWPYLRVANVQRGALVLDEVARFELYEGELEKHRLVAGDLLVVEGNGSETEIGRCARWGGEIDNCVHQNHLIRCRPTIPGIEHFTLVFLNSPTGMATMRSLAVTTSGLFNLSVGKIKAIRLVLPPLAEQHRIVARVDELMALLDRLEAAHNARDNVRRAARDAALAALRDAGDTEGVDVAWNRVATRMEVLFSGPEDVAGLRDACVALAVRGRMTMQNNAPSDGASALLSRCRAAKAVLVRSGRARREKPLPGLPDRPLPPGWALAHLRDVAAVFDPNPSHRYPAYASSGVPLLSTREFDGAAGWNVRTAPFVNEDFWRLQSDLCDFRPSDIVFARKGRLGLARSMPALPRFTFSHTVFAVKPLADVEPAYLLWALRQADVVAWLLSEMSDNTGVPTLGKAVLERLPVVVPPVGEQRRIVERVRTTVAICDDLEARLATVRNLQGQFAAAAVHHLDV